MMFIYVISGGDQCIIFKRSLSLDNKRTSAVSDICMLYLTVYKA